MALLQATELLKSLADDILTEEGDPTHDLTIANIFVNIAHAHYAAANIRVTDKEGWNEFRKQLKEGVA